MEAIGYFAYWGVNICMSMFRRGLACSRFGSSSSSTADRRKSQVIFPKGLVVTFWAGGGETPGKYDTCHSCSRPTERAPPVTARHALTNGTSFLFTSTRLPTVSIDPFYLSSSNIRPYQARLLALHFLLTLQSGPSCDTRPSPLSTAHPSLPTVLGAQNSPHGSLSLLI